MISYIFNEFQRGKWEDLYNWDYMATFQTLQTWIDHAATFEKFTYPLVTSISVILNVLLHISKLYNHG